MIKAHMRELIFKLARSPWIGPHIYGWRRRHQQRNQSTTTKFFRQLQQVAALEGPLAYLTEGKKLSVLVAGCSFGCEAYSLAGFLALRFPRLEWQIKAVDISREALKIAEASRYGVEHGLGSPRNDLIGRLEARLFNRSGDEWTVVPDIRERVSFAYGDVLSPEFRQFKDYDLVLGQNFMIHMNDALAERALAALVAAARPGGALFLGGMGFETKPALIAEHKLVPVAWHIAEIHEEDDMRRTAWPLQYWALEPINPRDPDYLVRYSTVFLKP
jgi:SAM-dependent methyltransferase